jgi:hypothetical protein
LQQGVEKGIPRALDETKGRHANMDWGRKGVIEAKDCFVWKGMEEDGVA